MYDRYTVGKSASDLSQHFGLMTDEAFEPNFNAYPTLKLPIVTSAEPERIQLFHWGLISGFSNNKNLSPKLYNLEWDMAYTKPMYKKTLQENRCLILADGYFAWKQISKRQLTPYYFYFPDKHPFYIAGIWESYEDFDGSTSSSFNMITVNNPDDGNSFQKDIPAILTGEHAKKWISSSHNPVDFGPIFQNFQFNKLSFHPVSPLITTLKISDERLIAPTQPSDQHGNYTLF